MPFSDLWAWLKHWRAKRDEEKYHQWCQFTQSIQRGADIFQIISIRQKAKTGLKAYARWLDGHTSAVWIPKGWPKVGVFVSAAGGRDYGRHHDEGGFYVNHLFGYIDAKYYEAMRRHVARNSVRST